MTGWTPHCLSLASFTKVWSQKGKEIKMSRFLTPFSNLDFGPVGQYKNRHSKVFQRTLAQKKLDKKIFLNPQENLEGWKIESGSLSESLILSAKTFADWFLFEVFKAFYDIWGSLALRWKTFNEENLPNSLPMFISSFLYEFPCWKMSK